ncbi:MAG: PAS domain S-box protein, partial [Bacteroidota bacterium]
MSSIKKQYRELLKTLQAYQAALNEAAIVSITDLKGRIMYVNDKFVEISGYSADELIGKNHRIINSNYHPPEFFKQLWETISKGMVWCGEIKNRKKDGSFYWVYTAISPVMDHKNKAYQYLSIRNPITLQKEHEEKLIKFQQELLKREQQLKDAQQVAKTGSWHLDIARNSLEWSKETYRIFEIA